MQNELPYRSYSQYLKERYGEKVYKLPVSLPVTCPNRDGTCGNEGCVFCGSIGAGYENLPADWTVTRQLASNREHISGKYKANKFIPYFQNFSNTYLPPEELRRYLVEACQPDVVALALATRPDCVSDAHLEVLQNIKETYNVDISVELGLQTVNYHTLDKIGRGHSLGEYLDAVCRLHRFGLECCTHLILNLPWDDRRDVVENAKVLSALGVEQVKLHALYIVKGTQMARWYEEGSIQLCSMEEYMERVILFLQYLHPDMVVQRLLGRAPESHTLFSNWQTGWWKIRDEIHATMRERGLQQGGCCNYLNGAAVTKKFGVF